MVPATRVRMKACCLGGITAKGYLATTVSHTSASGRKLNLTVARSTRKNCCVSARVVTCTGRGGRFLKVRGSLLVIGAFGDR